MKCSNCITENIENANYCHECGNRLEENYFIPGTSVPLKIEERCKLIFDSIPTPICVAREENNMYVLEHINRRFTEVFGYDYNDLATFEKWITKFFPDEHYDQDVRSLINSQIKRCHETNQVISQEYTVRSKDGSIKNIILRLRIIEGIKLIASYEDITTQKILEKMLLASKNELQAIYDCMVDGVLIADIETKLFVHANQAICKMYGYSIDEFLDMGIKDIHPEDSVDEVINTFEKQVRGEISIAQDLSCLKKDGSVFYADIISKYIIYNDRPSMIGFFRDTTERRNIDMMKENFVASLTHDLRVPLLAERNTLGYLVKGTYGELTDKQLDATNNMIRSNDGLINLVNTLLDVYSYDSGKVSLHKETLDLIEIINECISELTSLLDNKKIIYNYVQENSYILCADRKAIKRVVINIIDNAIKHTPDGCQIEVKAERINDYIIVAISDNGKGISEEDQEKIFNIYYSSSKKFRKVGTGLGLYLSKQIINAHGGKIWVKSESGSGATFYFSLPVE